MPRKQILSDSKLQRMGTLLEAIRNAESVADEWRARATIHVLRNYTTEPLDPFLKFRLLRDDIQVEISHGGYGTTVQEVLDPHSTLIQDPPDVIVLSLLIEILDPQAIEQHWQSSEAVRQLETIIGLLIERLPSLVVANRFIPPIADIRADVRRSDLVKGLEALNERLEALARQAPTRLRLVECDRIAAEIGPQCVDTRFWESAQAPFSNAFLDRYARRIAGFVRAAKGQTRKCLVLDCDNTLWGGVIGEDGLDGILLDSTQTPGQYFRNFQARLLELHEDGVLLTICSKNNPDDVWEVMARHPGCLLSKSHLAGWRINWLDKATNIASLVAELNIGMDSVVFLDDSPQERLLIEQALPEVTVLAVPDDLSRYDSMLDQDGWFETLAQTSEDQHRTRMYKEEAERKSGRNQFTDLTSYLISLKTVVRIAPMRNSEVERVGQLTRKTNQFNLTTRRYSDEDIRMLAADDDAAIFAMTVSDRYGNMGLTGVLIARRVGRTAFIDTLLLSCRVLGRRLEFAFVDQCMSAIADMWHPDEWVAEYVASAKNSQVAGFWREAGFTLSSEKAGHKSYVLREPCMDKDYLKIMDVELE